MSSAGRRFWQSPLPGLLPVLACFFAAGWHMRYDWLYDASYTYGWLVLPLALYLFSVRWRDRPEPEIGHRAKTLPWWIGIALLLPCCWLVREANPEWRLLSIFLAAASAGTVLLFLADAGGWRWMRHFAGPVAFFMACVPWPSLLERAATGVLMPVNASVASEVLQWMNIHASRRGNLISVNGGTLGVEEACSGIRSLQTVIMTAWFAGELQGLRWRQRCALLAAGVLMALLTNIIRTVSLCVIAARSGVQAVDSWHDTAGFAALGANVVAVLAAGAWMAKRFRKPCSKKRKKAAPKPPPAKVAWPHAGPGVVAAGLLAMIPVTEWWYGRKEVNPQNAWHMEKPAAEMNFSELPLNDLTVSMLRFSGGWSARWQTAAGHPLHGFYFYWEPGRVPPENMNVHQPGGCLANLGIEYIQELEPLPATVGGVPRSLRILEFRDQGRKLYVLYFVSEDSEAAGVTPGPFDFGYSGRLAAVLHGRRNPGQRFIEIGLWDEQSEAGARAIFASLLKAWLRDGEG